MWAHVGQRYLWDWPLVKSLGTGSLALPWRTARCVLTLPEELGAPV